MTEHLLFDLWYAVRVLLRSPGFSFIAIATMALQIYGSVYQHPFKGVAIFLRGRRDPRAIPAQVRGPGSVRRPRASRLRRTSSG
jgi:hypothetical protein